MNGYCEFFGIVWTLRRRNYLSKRMNTIFAKVAKAVSYNLILAWGCPNASTQTCAPSSSPGQFNSPLGVAVDASGRYVYVVDTINRRVQKFDSNGNFLTTWGTYGLSEGHGHFHLPACVAVDPSGNVYVTDQSCMVQKFDPLGNFITQWGSVGSGPGQFNNPFGIAADQLGNIYVTDTILSRVGKFDTSGNFITQWGSQGHGPAQFFGLSGVAVDPSGKYVYVADTWNERMQKFDSLGNFILQWGSPGSAPGQFNQPGCVAVDSSGNAYVTDSDGNNRVQKFDSSGNFLAQWSSWSSGQFWGGPSAIAIDSAGNVYVTDDNRVLKFQLFVKGKEKEVLKEYKENFKEAKDEVGIDHPKIYSKDMSDYPGGKWLLDQVGFYPGAPTGDPYAQSELWLSSSETIRRLTQRVENLETKLLNGKSFIKPEERPRVGRVAGKRRVR